MVVLGLTSCNREATRQLQYVQGIIQERPDTALTILQNLPAESLKASSQKALYSLLYAKALDKNYIDTTDVSIIEPAVEYYSRHRRDDRYAEALFYKGRICQNGGDNQTAITYFNEALDEVSEDNHILLDLIHSYIGTAYNATSNPTNELLHEKIAYEESIKTGIQDNIDSNLYVLSVAYHNCSQFEVSDSLLNMLLERVSKENYWLYSDAILMKAKNSVEKKNPDYAEAVRLFRIASEAEAEFHLEDYLEYKYALLKIGDITSAQEVAVNILTGEDNHASYWWRSQIALFSKDYRSSLAYLLNYIDHSRLFVSDAIEQSLLRQEKDYQEKKNMSLMQNRKILALVIVALALLFVVVVLVYTLVFYHKKEELNKQVRVLEEALLASQELLAVNQTATDDALHNIKHEYFSLYRKLLSEIERYCFEALENIEDGQPVVDLTRPLGPMIAAILDEKNGPSQLEAIINRDLDNIVGNLRQDYGEELSEDDICLFCYMVIGLSNRAITFLFDIPNGTLRSRKSRLKRKIQSSDGENRYLYDVFLQ